MRERIRYFDVLRIICFAAVLYYHMIVQLYLSDYYPVETVSPLFSNANMGLGSLAVGIFFMLSGAGLMTSTKDSINLKGFYVKRLARLLVPFYVVVAGFLAYLGLIAHDLGSVFAPGVPKWRIIFNFLGMDTWLNSCGIATYNTTIGEWFLGCLIVLYILFPLFRFLLLKNKWILLGVSTLIYVLSALFYPFKLSMDLCIIFKAYEFILGMYLGLFWKKISPKVLFITVPVMLFNAFFPFHVQMPYIFNITALSLSIFMTVSLLEPKLQKIGGKTLALISGLTYPIFLTHHQVIYRMTPGMRPYLSTPVTFVVMYLLELVVIIILAVVVNFISSRLLKLLSSLGN